jgi:hypothetical protein
MAIIISTNEPIHHSHECCNTCIFIGSLQDTEFQNLDGSPYWYDLYFCGKRNLFLTRWDTGEEYSTDPNHPAVKFAEPIYNLMKLNPETRIQALNTALNMENLNAST